MRSRTTPLTRRAALGLGLLATASACSLRLEDDAPLPGPTATPAPDASPLRDVRTHLVEVMSAAQHETKHVAEARAAQAWHREHLTRLDATLEGLDVKHLASASATADPTAPASPSASAASASPTAGGATPSAIHPSAPTASASASPAATPWTRAESAWTSGTMPATLQRVSEKSRPLALAIAARGVASLPGGSIPAWGSDLRISAGTAFLSPLAEAIAALEWLAATTPFDQRVGLSDQLHQLYAVRSAADAGDASSAARASAPTHRYTSSADARTVVGRAGEAMASACAAAAGRTRSSQEAGGLVFAWSSAVSTQTFAGLKPGAWPGLAA